MTLRSNDQFNMTIYGYEDRLRDVSGTRDIMFMNSADIEQFGLFDGNVIGLATEADDAIIREKHRLKVFAYDVPRFRGAVSAATIPNATCSFRYRTMRKKAKFPQASRCLSASSNSDRDGNERRRPSSRAKPRHPL
jgi:hypothetical protein